MRELGQMDKCDVCGKSVVVEEYTIDNPANPDYGKKEKIRNCALMHNHFGYYSKKDLENHECVMCEECYDKIRDFIKSLGGRVRVYEYHICTGLSVRRWKEHE